MNRKVVGRLIHSKDIADFFSLPENLRHAVHTVVTGHSPDVAPVKAKAHPEFDA